METIFLPSGVIAVFFVLVWIVQYPGEMWLMISMRGRTLTDKAVGAVIWVFLLVAVMTIVWLCDKLMSNAETTGFVG